MMLNQRNMKKGVANQSHHVLVLKSFDRTSLVMKPNKVDGISNNIINVEYEIGV